MNKSIKRKTTHVKRRSSINPVSLDFASQFLLTRNELETQFDFSKIDDTSLFSEYLLVFGSHETSPNKPSLLFQFPATKIKFFSSVYQKIKKYCYPDGMKHSYRANVIQEQFCFCFTEKLSLYFGICTHFSLFQKRHFLSTELNTNLYCLCTITKVPSVKAHFLFHTVIISVLRLTMKPFFDIDFKHEHDIDVLIDKEQVQSDIEHFLTLLDIPLKVSDTDGMFMSCEPDLIPSYFRVLVRKYSLVKMHPNESMDILIDDEFSITIPSISDSPFELACASFDYLFSYLCIEDIVRYLRALLLEEKILIISDEITNLSFVVLSALVLVQPMNLRIPISPVVPATSEYLDILDGNYPFVIGSLNNDILSNKTVTEDITVINLTKGLITYPDYMKHMPGASELRNKLRFILKLSSIGSHHSKIKSPLYTMHEFSQLKVYLSKKQVGLICEAFQKVVSPLIDKEKLMKCRVRDLTNPDNPAVGFMQELYLIDAVKRDREFLEWFITTASFKNYCERILFD